MYALDHSVQIPVAGAFRRVNEELLNALSGLSAEDWDRPTVHPARTVKDLAAHLLHGSFRRVSGLRDQYRPPGPSIGSNADLIDFIQQDNRDFMTGMRRVSPQILIELIERYDREVLALFEALDPDEAGLGVAWAGESSSPRWFDIAREYTEKWHHQQQIRDATELAPLYSEELFVPVLETFARGLPYAYRSLSLPEGTSVVVSTSGLVSLSWILVRQAGEWVLCRDADTTPTAAICLPADTAWRVWSKSLSPDEARREASVEGDASALEPLLAFVAIMA